MSPHRDRIAGKILVARRGHFFGRRQIDPKLQAVNGAVSGVSKVHTIIGGFHLAPFKDDYVRDVVSDIRRIDPDYVVPMHCSGEPFYEIMKAEMPTKLLRSFTGSRFIFES